jgi:hypothetical protein
MHYIIRLVGLVSGETSEDEARYLCRIVGRSGERGFLSTTPDRDRALAFRTPQAAFEFWLDAPVTGFHAVIVAATPEARARGRPPLDPRRLPVRLSVVPSLPAAPPFET